MDEELRAELTTILGILALHEALIAVLYADHIEHDKELRENIPDAVKSLQAFRNYTNHYLEDNFRKFDPRGMEIEQAARDRVKDFFRDAEAILLKRHILEKPDPFL